MSEFWVAHHLPPPQNTISNKIKQNRRKRGTLDNVDINEHSKEANECKRVGDYEVDTIIGKNHKGTNSLRRQYFLKSMKLVDIAVSEVVRAIIDKFNSRVKKCLGGKTPYEVFRFRC